MFFLDLGDQGQLGRLKVYKPCQFSQSVSQFVQVSQFVHGEVILHVFYRVYAVYVFKVQNCHRKHFATSCATCVLGIRPLQNTILLHETFRNIMRNLRFRHLTCRTVARSKTCFGFSLEFPAVDVSNSCDCRTLENVNWRVA